MFELIGKISLVFLGFAVVLALAFAFRGAVRDSDLWPNRRVQGPTGKTICGLFQAKRLPGCVAAEHRSGEFPG